MNLYKESEKNLVNDINNDERKQEQSIDNNKQEKKLKLRKKTQIKTYILKKPKYNFEIKQEKNQKELGNLETINYVDNNNNNNNNHNTIKFESNKNRNNKKLNLRKNNKRNTVNENNFILNNLNILELKHEDIISSHSIISEKSENKKSEKENKEMKEKIYLTDNEKYEDMEYDEVLNNDKRNFYQIYKSFLFEEHIIFNTFCSEIYLELRTIKISFLFFGYAINFFLNAIFYTDEYISDTYHNNDILDFASSLPKSIYSFIATIIISSLLKMLSNRKKQLSKIINEKKEKNEFYNAFVNELEKLKKKLMIYYIIVFVLGIFLCYYSAAFCAVYRNSQIYWFLGCVESSVLDLITPFIICLLLAGLRYISLALKNKCIFKIETLLSSIL